MKQNGSVLILSLWILSVLFFGTVTLAFYALGELKASNRSAESFKSGLVFDASVYWVNDLYFKEENKRPLWLGNIRVPDQWQKELQIVGEDESSKLNLNLASGKELLYLLEGLKKEGLSLDSKKTVQDIIAYRSNKPFELVEEIEFLNGVHEADIKIVKPYLTVYSSDRVNLNTAKDRVIEAVIFSLQDSDEKIKKRIYESILRHRSNGSFFESNDLSEESLISKLGLDRSPETNEALTKLLQRVSLSSDAIHVEVTYKKKRAAEIILKPKSDPKILFWHESRLGTYAA